MNNYYRYLPVSDEDQNWGLWALNAGTGRILKSELYPNRNHPAHHYFNWTRGRVLREYQIIYISKGQGSFESSSCRDTPVGEGTMILLFPNEWHRYKPDVNTGWDEHWIGFNGEMMDHLVGKNFFQPGNPLLPIGHQESVVHIFNEIIEKTKEEKAGYQPSISGAVMHLLGKIYSCTKQQLFETQDQVELTVSRARILLRENVDRCIAVEDIARELQVGYSWFRKVFKAYTGMAPGQYLIQLKIERSKELLLDKNKSIKEVAYELNFDTSFYFSKLFKNKTGFSPEQFRKTLHTK
ncbi:MAG: AraC family transcriptional regulator [Chitinophagaceae bacterium]|nr:AraC family transcriptional regulator [Chitinophagaceae bacterium]